MEEKKIPKWTIALGAFLFGGWLAQAVWCLHVMSK